MKNIKQVVERLTSLEDIMTWDGNQSDPANITLTSLVDSKTTGINGVAAFTGVESGNYTVQVESGNFNKEYSTDVNLTGNQSVQANVVALYTVEISPIDSQGGSVSGATVTFTDSEGKVETITGTPNALFMKKPAGNYTVKITKEGYSETTETGVLEGTSTSIQLNITLNAATPKLVQITSSQTGYQLDTSYNYISLLVVGRGSNCVQNGERGVIAAGNGGMVVYVPNLLISDIGETTADIFVEASSSSAISGLTSARISFGGNTNKRIAANTNAAPYNAPTPGFIHSSFSPYYFGCTQGGGILKFSKGIFSSGGSSSSGTLSYEYTKVEGGSGGDGVYGTRGIGLWDQEYWVRYPSYSSSVVIPVSSIFGGSGVGGYAEDSQIGPSVVYGGGGYADINTVEGNISYGCGASFSYNRNSDKYSAANPMSGIICIYYHNEPLTVQNA